MSSLTYDMFEILNVEKKREYVMEIVYIGKLCKLLKTPTGQKYMKCLSRIREAVPDPPNTSPDHGRQPKI